jgi:hypothetical protein
MVPHQREGIPSQRRDLFFDESGVVVCHIERSLAGRRRIGIKALRCAMNR